MSVEHVPGGTVIKGAHIDLFRMCVLRNALKLEIKGMKRRGRSAYTIIKSEFGLKGSRESVLKQFELRIKELDRKLEGHG